MILEFISNVLLIGTITIIGFAAIGYYARKNGYRT